jgi:hypothetical protein
LSFAPHHDDFITKLVGLGFPIFASKLIEKRWRVVHVASSWRSRGSEVRDGQFVGVGVRCNGSQTKLPFFRCNFPFNPQGHSRLFFSL